MVNPIGYLKQVQEELTKVTWPNREQTVNMTILVIAVSLVVAVYLAGLDFVMNALIGAII